MNEPPRHSSGEADALLPDDWRELAHLVDCALDAPPDARPSLIAELSGGDPRRLVALTRLVSECEREMPLIEKPAAERFASLFANEADAAVPDVLGGRYRIEREIGRGGMASVYLAHDVKHSRNVAVKVIRPDLAASLGRERFLREIAIAARLRHPNIVPLYDSGDADGLLYFVMPYEEGPSLRARLAERGSIPVAERVSTLRDVARALAYAHEHGVVHRDVKPDNVMLCGGAAVVTDFGIAKAVSVAQSDGAPATLTQTGAGIGTPAYMAPEQAIGDPSTDHRADIYSFGCVAYELFAGTPPFHGLPMHQIVAAHVATKPIPIADVCPDVPTSIASLIGRCIEKNPADRPQSAKDVLAELETLPVAVSATVGASAPLASEPKRRRVSRGGVLVLSTLAVTLIVGAAYYRTNNPSAPVRREQTVAVMPLITSGDSLQRELAEGLADEVATALFKVPGVRVKSQRGATNYRGLRDVDVPKIGRELGVKFLVTGWLREVSGRLRVLVNLFGVGDGTMVWSDQYDRDPADLESVRDDIAKAVGDTLRRMLGASAPPLNARTTARVNSDAFRLYVLAKRALDRRGQSTQASIDNFRRATELDTLYADAYSGLSLALALSPYFQPISTEAVRPEVIRTAQRALHLDPTLGQAHIALGLMHMHAYDWQRAEDEFRTAVRLDNRDVEARVQYGRMLVFRGRVAEALAQFLAARQEDPASAVVSSWVSYTYYIAGQIDSALVESDRAFQSDSTNMTTVSLGSLVRLKAGQTARAREFAGRMPPTHPVLLYVLGMTGDSAVALERLRKIESRQPKPWLAATTRGFTMLGLGDTTEAMAALERATDAKENWPSLEGYLDPMFDPLRRSARFQRLLQRVGLGVSASSR